MHRLPRSVASSELASQLGLEHVGPVRAISTIAPCAKAESGTLTFGRPPDGSWSEAIWITAPGAAAAGATQLLTSNPRLGFIRALILLRELGAWPAIPAGGIGGGSVIHPTAVVSAGARIGKNCHIGAHSVIHDTAVIGDGVVIGAGTVIGQDGFGYERGEDGKPLHFPHLGHVVIEDGVAVGNLCSISRGTLEDTVIGASTKIDDQCYLAHNVTVGASTLIMSGVRLNGRVTIGGGTWVGTGALVREGIEIGQGAIVGMGAVVVKSFPQGGTIAGNPARTLR